MQLTNRSSNRAVFSRRSFLKGTLLAGIALGFPSILHAQLRPPGRRIRIGLIGCGRIAQPHAEMLALEPDVELVAVCDLDAIRVEKMRKKLMAKQPELTARLKVYADYRELLANPDVDAVLIATPDHWHALVGVEAALAGKDFYVEKPCSLTIAEGIALSAVAAKQNRIVQVGSQQRSGKQFVRACEIVRNGAIGKVTRVRIGIPGDRAGGRVQKMPVPPGLNYAQWLGSSEEVYYTEDRVHPQGGVGRPGWMQCEHSCKGMITNWGAHHVDIAHWALGFENTGPVKATGHAQFLNKGLWDVHGEFEAALEYEGGVVIEIGSKFEPGVRFEGEGGWLFVARDPVRPKGDPNGKPILQSLDAQDRSILKAGPGPIRLGAKGTHHRNWLDSIVARQQPVAPIQQGHRSASACQLAYTAMKLGRPVRWDPGLQQFPEDAEAARLMAIPERGEFSIPKVLKAAGMDPSQLGLQLRAEKA